MSVVLSPVGKPIGNVFHRLTEAESDAGLTERDIVGGHPPGDVRRYGQNATPGTTNMTAAIQNLAAVLNAQGGGEAVFQREDYLYDGSTLFDLEDTRGVTIRGNGARFVSSQTNGSVRFAISLTTCFDTIVENLRLLGSNTSLAFSTGEGLITLLDGTCGTLVQNCHTENCSYYLRSGDASAPPNPTNASRIVGITVLNGSMLTTYYGINCQGNGDSLFVRGFKSRNAGRTYFPWNCRNHDVWVDSEQGGEFDDCLLKVYVNTTWGYTRLENIRLNYTSRHRYATGSNQDAGSAMIAIDVQQESASNQGAAFIDGIHITFDVEADNSPTNVALFTVRRFDENGDADTTSRSHQFSNWHLTGTARGVQNFTSDVIDLFSSIGTWTGDLATGITLEDIYLSGAAATAAVVVDGTPFSGSFSAFTMRNVITDGGVAVSGYAADSKLEFVNIRSTTAGFDGALSPTQLAANTDNYSPSGWGAWVNTLRLSTDASRNLTGIVPVMDRHELRIVNVGAQDLVLVDSATSTAANQFALGANVTLGANEGINLWYDPTSDRWRAVGRHN